MLLHKGSNIMFYDRFLRECAKKGITPSKVLDELNISRGNMGKWKSGGQPRNENKKAIADFLGIDVEVLNNDKIEKPAPKHEDGREYDEIYQAIRRLNDRGIDRLAAYAQGLLAHPEFYKDEK